MDRPATLSVAERLILILVALCRALAAIDADSDPAAQNLVRHLDALMATKRAAAAAEPAREQPAPEIAAIPAAPHAHPHTRPRAHRPGRGPAPAPVRNPPNRVHGAARSPLRSKTGLVALAHFRA